MNDIKEILRTNRKYLFYEMIVLAIIGLFVFRDYLVVLPPINRDYPLAPSEIVLPRNTQLIKECSNQCTRCTSKIYFGSFVTDLSPTEVIEYYRKYLQSHTWENLQEDYYPTENPRADSWNISARWPFGETEKKDLTIYIEVTGGHNPAPHLPNCKTFEEDKFIGAGRTIFGIGIFLTKDKEIRQRNCGNIDEFYQCNYFEIG